MTKYITSMAFVSLTALAFQELLGRVEVHLTKRGTSVSAYRLANLGKRALN